MYLQFDIKLCKDWFGIKIILMSLDEVFSVPTDKIES